ncbi:RNA recognition family protein [Cryptosporidium andersoni]|uniref:RNA recognition family protein n=1 Tax=Cryptosporidium andersoni TaxID=117008 RepID=A0A1J4MTC5_9CRYT|nr:RNA recognition family protein [Cryptosporidium andersoni]
MSRYKRRERRSVSFSSSSSFSHSSYSDEYTNYGYHSYNSKQYKSKREDFIRRDRYKSRDYDTSNSQRKRDSDTSISSNYCNVNKSDGDAYESSPLGNQSEKFTKKFDSYSKLDKYFRFGKSNESSSHIYQASSSRSSKARQFRFDSPPKELQNQQSSSILTNFTSATSNSSPLNNSNTAKPYREVYVGNLPSGIGTTTLLEFMNQFLIKNCNITTPGNPFVSAWISSDGKYAFCECRSMEEANMALQLNNTINLNGNILRIGRPKTIENSSNINSSNEPNNSVVSSISTQSSTTFLSNIQPIIKKADRIVISGFPYSYSDEDIEDIIREINGNQAIKLLYVSPNSDKGRVESSNCLKIAICEFEDVVITERVIRRVNTQSVCNLKLNAFRSHEALQNKYILNVLSDEIHKIYDYEVKQLSSNDSEIPTFLLRGQIPCRCIKISNIITPEELVVDNIYNEIMDEIKQEVCKYGNIKHIVIPRPASAFKSEDSGYFSIYGSVFVLYNDVQNAIDAKINLYKMKFSGRSVCISYYPENYFIQNNFSWTHGNRSIPLSSEEYLKLTENMPSQNSCNKDNTE